MCFLVRRLLDLAFFDINIKKLRTPRDSLCRIDKFFLVFLLEMKGGCGLFSEADEGQGSKAMARLPRKF